MAKRKKPTQLQIEYNKQIKRLKQAVRRAEKRGYIIPDNIIPEKPKRVTRKTVEKLKQITPTEIYSKSEKLDFETGELIAGDVARKIERSISAKKAAKTRKEKRFNAKSGVSEYYTPSYEMFPSAAEIIISNFKAYLARFPEVAQSIASRWLNRLINDYSLEDVAEMLENAAAQGFGINYSVAYREDILLDRLSEMLEFLPGASTGNKKDIMEAIEYEEDWELPD